MLVFIDESGDPGFKINSGSSKYFTIGMVIFEDNEEACGCDKKIDLLKMELGWKSDSEFHFCNNSDRIREAFLKAVIPYNFFYYGFVINKDPKKLWGEGFRNKESFYKYACGLVFENAKDKLNDAIVVLDKSGNSDFRKSLSKYLKNKINTSSKLIKKVKMERSDSNSLLQLADYICGVINRSINNNKLKKDAFRSFISHREIRVQIWPPK